MTDQIKQISSVYMQSLVGHVYTRFVQAALNGTYVTYPDISSVLFHYPLTTATKEQIDSMWALFDLIVQMDAKANRLPLAALFVSRSGGKRMPKHPFFESYSKHYGEVLTEEGWHELVKEIWDDYKAPKLEDNAK